MIKNKKIKLDSEIKKIADSLSKAGYQAYLVGGCVRDLLLDREPKDWDITTNAEPPAIQKIFPDSVYENEFGTVGVKTRSRKEKLKIIEITTFRSEGRYSDKRHPDKISFAKNIEEDLARRDFTINAMGIKLTGEKKPTTDFEITDPYDGQKDLDKKIVRAVGNPDQRFKEDALRLLRAIRFATELNFTIEPATAEAIQKNFDQLKFIAQERIRDEFTKIILSDQAKNGVELLEKYGLLKNIVPELREGINCGQNLHHIYTVWEHNLRALDYAVEKKCSLPVRLAALFHDVGKPRTKNGDGHNSTFYNHEYVGAKMTATIMKRLVFSKEIAEKTAHLVRCHLFYYNVGEVTEAGVRRFLQRVGPENIPDLIKIREADRIGSGVPKAVPYKIRHLLFMIDKVKKDPISPKMIKINGTELMTLLKIEPGPKIGAILSILLEEILDDPKKNNKIYLKKKGQELNQLTETELKAAATKAKAKKSEFEASQEEEIKKKHWV
ncbi:MAG: HDIG domain-containing protein [bacterium]|nr:HDIG domain-containing protein [bacterium]